MGDTLRFAIRVKPGSRFARVGGTWGEDRVLKVSVQARAVDGKANKAVIEALAGALQVKKGQIRIVSGDAHRSKVIEVAEATDATKLLLEHRRMEL